MTALPFLRLSSPGSGAKPHRLLLSDLGRGKKSVVFETVESGDTGGRKPLWFLLQTLSACQPSVQPPARRPGVVNGALIRGLGIKARAARHFLPAARFSSIDHARLGVDQIGIG